MTQRNRWLAIMGGVVVVGLAAVAMVAVFGDSTTEYSCRDSGEINGSIRTVIVTYSPKENDFPKKMITRIVDSLSGIVFDNIKHDGITNEINEGNHPLVIYNRGTSENNVLVPTNSPPLLWDTIRKINYYCR